MPGLRRVRRGGQFEIRNSRRGGFTLIEVLLSLALLTIVLGVVYSSFFTVQRALERFDGISLKYHEARTALDIIRREIDGAILEKSQLPDSDETGICRYISDQSGLFQAVFIFLWESRIRVIRREINLSN